MITTILLDVDGISADFFSAALAAHGCSHLKSNWPCNEWNMAKVMGLTEEQFWLPIDTYEFWGRVKIFKGAVEFYKELCKLAPVVFSTSPSFSPDCAKAKIEWLRYHFGGEVSFMIGAQKQLMASEHTLLVDDYDKNIQKFRAAGGCTVLFPRIYNSAHVEAANREPPELFNLVLSRVEACVATSQVEKSILQEAAELTAGARQASYGHPLDDFTKTGLIWTGVLHDMLKPNIVISAERVALCMAGVKMSRETTVSKRDNRVDGPGYWNCLDMVINERQRRQQERLKYESVGA